MEGGFGFVWVVFVFGLVLFVCLFCLFVFKADLSFDNEELGFYLLRKWEFRSQASAAPKAACFHTT